MNKPKRLFKNYERPKPVKKPLLKMVTKTDSNGNEVQVCENTGKVVNIKTNR